jgi:hypothetical protein
MNISTAVDVTPTWTGLLPALVQLADHKDQKVRADTWTELRRMAGAADHWNTAGPELVAALAEAIETMREHGLTPPSAALSALTIAKGIQS